MPFIVPVLGALGGALTGGALSGTAATIAGGAGLAGIGAKTAGTILGAGPKTPVYTPQIQSEQDNLLQILHGMLDPSKDSTLAPIKAASLDTINRNYATLPNKVTASAAARGFGSSGKLGGGLLGIESDRLHDLSGLEGAMAQLGSQRQMTAAQIMQRMIESNKGEPGHMLSAGLESGGTSLLGLLAPTPDNKDGTNNGSILQQMLKNLKVKGSGASTPGSGGGGVDPALIDPGPQSSLAPAAASPLSALMTLHTMLNLGGGVSNYDGTGWG
jgi:hypothetical protein